jgi:hypothetical protein
MIRLRALIVACVVAAAASVAAQQSSQSGKPAAQTGQAAKPAAPSFSDQFPGLEFRNIGPFRGGRVTTVAGLRNDPLSYIFGSTGGGLWRTTDGGATWKPLADKYLKQCPECEQEHLRAMLEFYSGRDERAPAERVASGAPRALTARPASGAAHGSKSG